MDGHFQVVGELIDVGPATGNVAEQRGCAAGVPDGCPRAASNGRTRGV